MFFSDELKAYTECFMDLMLAASIVHALSLLCEVFFVFLMLSQEQPCSYFCCSSLVSNVSAMISLSSCPSF